jgi:hypothetical protein
MNKLIMIILLAVNFTANAQSYSPEADSVILSKDSVTAYLTMLQMSSDALPEFLVTTQYGEFIPFSPMYHWEKYVKGTYENADSITCFNRDNVTYITEYPLKIRTFRFWKDGEVKRWIAYIFMYGQLQQILDTNLGNYYTSEEEAERMVFKEFEAKRKL